MSTSPRTPFPANANECPECKKMALPFPKSYIVYAVACQACGAIIEVKNGIMEVSPRTKGTRIDNYIVTFDRESPFTCGWVEIDASSKQKAIEEAEKVFGHHYNAITSRKFFYDSCDGNETIEELYPEGKIGKTLKAY